MAIHTQWAQGIGRFFMPSFLADLIWPKEKPKWKLHPTSYLDGLRGVASLIVFFCHYTEENHWPLTASYGVGPEDTRFSWIQLPFARIIFSGRPMVHIFFVISGFALSYKPIQTIHNRDYQRCLSVLASSAFRRPIRLFAPCLVSTFMVLILIQTGWMGGPIPPLADQLRSWCDNVFHRLIWAWSWDNELFPDYDRHLWTIPVEFIHSMLLFIVVVALARLRRRLRLALVFALMLFFLRCGKWAAFEFIGGMFLAENFLIRRTRERYTDLDSDVFVDKSQLLPLVKMALHISIFVVGIFIAGWPNDNADKTPGIRYLLAQTPQPFRSMDALAPQKFYFAISAIFMVWSAGELSLLRRVLEGPLCQYLGRISYAVYICHGPAQHLLQHRILGHPFIPEQGILGQEGYAMAIDGFGIRNIFGVDTPLQLLLTWFFGLVILSPMVVWTADVFWRWVDNPIINAAKKLEAVCLDPDQSDEKAIERYSLVA
jgi:peptidoglycan/LPS O-acetylase OafA/YrhL